MQRRLAFSRFGIFFSSNSTAHCCLSSSIHDFDSIVKSTGLPLLQGGCALVLNNRWGSKATNVHVNAVARFTQVSWSFLDIAVRLGQYNQARSSMPGIYLSLNSFINSATVQPLQCPESIFGRFSWGLQGDYQL